MIPGRHHAKGSKPDTKDQICYNSSPVMSLEWLKFIETERRMMVAKNRGGGEEVNV